ncbi:hypothetical protein ABIB27_003869 [Arthrobacter sp. UYEF21]
MKRPRQATDQDFSPQRPYLNPPESTVVLRVDEKSHVQSLAGSQPAFPMMPEKRTHDYVRQEPRPSSRP